MVLSICKGPFLEPFVKAFNRNMLLKRVQKVPLKKRAQISLFCFHVCSSEQSLIAIVPYCFPKNDLFFKGRSTLTRHFQKGKEGGTALCLQRFKKETLKGLQRLAVEGKYHALQCFLSFLGGFLRASYRCFHKART